MRPAFASLAAVLIAAPLLCSGLDGPAFDDPGEGMHAEIARELVRSKNPFDLRLNGVAYLDKPPLLYVLLAGVFTLVGPTEAAARAVSAAAALVAVAATVWLAARLCDWRAGLFAGGALLGGAGFFAYARYVRPDAL